MPYLECPRVENPPAKKMIARIMRMMSSKHLSLLVDPDLYCGTLMSVVQVELFNYHALVIQKQATAATQTHRPSSPAIDGR